MDAFKDWEEVEEVDECVETHDVGFTAYEVLSIQVVYRDNWTYRTREHRRSRLAR